jgi:periplasmic divalent cation tolerance protein
MEYIQVLTTLGEKEDAHNMADTLVRKKLAGCVQVIGPISSTYWWNDRVEKDKEWLCLIKTKKILFEELKKTIESLHTYETPEIIAMPIVAGSKRYLDWLTNILKKK